MLRPTGNDLRYECEKETEEPYGECLRHTAGKILCKFYKLVALFYALRNYCRIAVEGEFEDAKHGPRDSDKQKKICSVVQLCNLPFDRRVEPVREICHR